MASEDPQKISLKSMKNMKLSDFFSDLQGLKRPCKNELQNEYCMKIKLIALD